MKEVGVLADTARVAAPAVVIDQAEDLRRRLLEQESVVRVEAGGDGVDPSRVEAALTSTRAAAHVLETISTAVAGELEQRWVASHVVRFAAGLIDSAQEQLLPPAAGRTSAPLARPALRVAHPVPPRG